MAVQGPTAPALVTTYEALQFVHVQHRVVGHMGGRARIEHLDALVAAHAHARGDQLADDDVLLEAHQGVHFALDGGVGQNAGGLLEGSRI